MRQARLNITIL